MQFDDIVNPPLGRPLIERFWTPAQLSKYQTPTQPLDGPPEGMVARVWAPNTNAFSPGEIWISSVAPITIWAGADVITSWYDRWARPRRIVTGPMTSLRYTITQVNSSDIAAAQVIVWNAVGNFTGIPTPPPFLGNSVLPAGPLPSSPVAGTVLPTSPITSTIDSVGASSNWEVLVDYEYDGIVWVSGGTYNPIIGAPDSQIPLLNTLQVEAIPFGVQPNLNVNVVLTPTNAFGSGPPLSVFTAEVSSTELIKTFTVSSLYTRSAVNALNYHPGNDSYRPTSLNSLYWLGDRTATGASASMVASGASPTTGDRIVISANITRMNIVLRDFPGSAPYLPESISGYTFP